jgi:hypothetical protein
VKVPEAANMPESVNGSEAANLSDGVNGSVEANDSDGSKIVDFVKS